ncbi:nitric-oxide reductase large subunit [Brevundimonas sp.]|uniref:nitric-oxide reductase large subunit n=1 Tax=Brevundimonas sp. TaxID=1871086 RepID=UPI002D37854F|nr:nitric-oxide reductase large subunit [Brevundimonas sp.]HYC67314.1 nitric-oxide reductase large subunit [Brevundimonas sp.]
MNSTRKLWIWLAVLLISSFAVLLWTGSRINESKPPLPERVVSESGQVIYTRADLEHGRQVWQQIGGMQLGSIWGHGGYVAPDWSADWLHREAVAVLDTWARRTGAPDYASLTEEQQAGLQGRLRAYMRTNTYDPATGTITLPADRAAAIPLVSAHYENLFGEAPSHAELRENYAMKNGTVARADDRQALSAFFWWTSWAATTERPNDTVTYTNNWPSEPLVANRPPASTFLWSAFSVTFLLAGIALLGWHHAVTHGRKEAPHDLPKTDPMRKIVITPSMAATAKYFWVVLALFLLQIFLGAMTAHYQVEGQLVYGYEMAEILPYSITRTWHTQLAVLWIATAWLGTGLYMAPAISGHEPRFQKLGVNILWVCLLIIVVGSFVGQWLAVMQMMDLKDNFWWGHQGWEYADGGRFWQWFLFIGLMIWLVLVGRALWPALKRGGTGGESRSIIGLFFLSTVAIGLFYAAALFWNEHTHISIVEYWRWWLVHLWVEGFFEVFATAVIAFLFTRLGLIPVRVATVAVLFATIVFMAGGVLGTLHHLYFAGSPTPVLALGASFSALEVVPLAYIGFEAYDQWRLAGSTPWMRRYKWPVMFFLAVAFWNLVGAGLFGFLINPPLSLYYMQGLNLTPLHAHTALFGVYGMLGVGLVLFCLRGMRPDLIWNETLLRISFWCFNIGLAMMALLTLLPMGTVQLLTAVREGYWFARSEQFMQQPLVDLLVWMRVPGDVVFSIGAVALGLFVASLWIRPRREAPEVEVADEPARLDGGER